jgi:UDP-glucose 4-epimerase
VIAIFLEKLRAGQPIELHGDGRQLRDFVHVSDVAAAVELALDTTEDVTWNVCSGHAASVVGVAQAIGRVLGLTPTIQHLPRRAGDVDISLLSPAALLATGRWGPPLSLEEGLRLTLGASPAPVIAAPAEA